MSSRVEDVAWKINTSSRPCFSRIIDFEFDDDFSRFVLPVGAFSFLFPLLVLSIFPGSWWRRSREARRLKK